jgi:AcrR family transcriptional regulator
MGAELKRRPPPQSRRELMATAIDCFAAYGYQGTSIDRIARAAGVTKGALYYHFRDKEQLLFEAVRDRVADFEHRVVAAVTPVKDPVEAVRKVAASCLFVATRNNHRRFLLTLMVEALDTNPALAAEFREVMRRFRAFVAALVRIGQERGVFRDEVDPAAAAKVFAGGVMGGEIQYYQDSDDVDLEQVMTALVDQFLGWLSVNADTGGGRGQRVAAGPADEEGSSWLISGRATNRK